MIELLDMLNIKHGRIKSIRILIFVIANIYIRAYSYFFIFSKFVFKIFAYKPQAPKKIEAFVSITSFPERINTLAFVLISLARTKANVGYNLFLAKDQFKSFRSLPYLLRTLQRLNIITIFFVSNDFKSYKKYYYISQINSNIPFLTFDDDIIYNKKSITNLLKFHKSDQNAIIANLSMFFEDPLTKEYCSWDKVEMYNTTHKNIFPIGAGGVLYPPLMNFPLFYDINNAQEICPSGDDIWLYFCAKHYKIKTIAACLKSSYLPIFIRNNRTLHEINNLQGKNSTMLTRALDFFKAICLENK